MKVSGLARGGRLRRWLLRGFGAGSALLVLALGGLLVLVHNLDRAWVRQRLSAFFLASHGVEIDYGAVRVGVLSDLAIDDLVVRSPAAVRAFAPELLRVGRLRAHWSLATLFGATPAVREIEIEHVTLTVVADEHGRTSFDDIPSTPSPPLSRHARELLGTGLPVRRISVRDVTLSLIQNARGVTVEQDTLRGLSLDAQSGRLVGGPSLRVALGGPQAPLTLKLERQRNGTADGTGTAQASLVLDVTPSDAHAALDIRVRQQDLAPDVAVDHLARFEARAHFDAQAGRTELTISQLQVGDGVATLEASLQIPDHGSPLVQRAAGDVDAVRLLRLLPRSVAPLRVGSGRLHYRIAGLVLDQPTSTAAITVDADLVDLGLELEHGSLSLGRLRGSLLASPSAAGLAAEGSLVLDEARAESGTSQLSGDGIGLKFSGVRDKTGALTGNAELRFATLGVSGPNALSAREGSLELRARELTIDSAVPLTTRGDVTVDASALAIEVQRALRAVASGVHLRAHAPLSGRNPLAFDANLEVDRLRILHDGHTLADLPVRVRLGLEEVAADLTAPAKSEGVARVSLEAGALHAALDATKRGDALDYDLSASAAQLAELRALLPEDVARRARWEQMAFDVRSSGRLEHLTSANPELRERTELRLTGVAFDTLAARTIALELRSNGTAVRQDAHADLRSEALSVGGALLGDEHVSLSVLVDRTRPSLQLEVESDRVPKVELNATLAFDRAQRIVSYEATGHVAGLSALAPLLSEIPALAGIDWSELDLRGKAQGNLAGVSSGFDAKGALQVAPDPVHSARGSGTLELAATHFRWSDGDRAFAASAAQWHAALLDQGQRCTLDSDLTADELEVGLGRHRLGITGLRDRSSLTLTGGLASGVLELSQKVSIDAVKQNFVPMYVIGELTGSLRASREAGGLIKISDLQIDNRAGGTTLAAQGGIDLDADQRRLSLRATVHQDLALLSKRRDLFVGRGSAGLKFSVESADFHVFHSKATLELAAAHGTFPTANVDIDTADGEVPIVSDLTFGRQGIELLRGVQINPYATLRFTDQHPLLENRSFLAIARLTTPFISIAPFAANLKVEQNIVSLSQLEMGVRGGSITGDGVLNWNGAQSTLQADVRANGVRSSHGEPFDGNAALLVDLGDRSVDGRADILRIGRRHLLDLLDLEDPHRTNTALNRIRGALGLGYPKRVTLSFKHGFASAGVSFGGLAGLVSVDDVRGIPVGPLMERIVRSFQPQEEP